MIEELVKLTDEEKKRRRARSVAIASVLGGLVVLFYAITWFKFVF